METPKPKRGRPFLPPGERMIQRSIRLSADQWAKIDMHGLEWLRALIRNAKSSPVPADKPPE